MRVNGEATLGAPAEQVWQRMLDPEVLRRSIPGCERLEETGPESYRGTITAGVGSVKGTFQGEVKLTDLNRPASLVLRASGSGAPGTVQANVAVELRDLDDGRTELTYDAEAVVGGMVGGVGQRMLTGVARKMAGEFLSRLDDEVTGRAPAERERSGETGAPAAAVVDTGGAATVSAPARAPTGSAEFVKGVAVGAATALAGVVVGALISGRRRH